MKKESGPMVGFMPLPAGRVVPGGWVGDLMTRDWEQGFAGHLDRLVPELFADEIYGRDRLGASSRHKDLGALSGVDHANAEQFLWWNSETQSNWREGWLGHALIVGGDRGRQAARRYVDQILATQDEDGYLGIYDPALRFRFQGENGELWAQATLLRGLLMYGEAMDDAPVVEAVIRAVRRTMAAWPLPGSHPFRQPGSWAGNAHGLMFVDVLDHLSRLTGDPSWREYAVALYDEYSGSEVSEKDCQLRNLLDPEYRFTGHGVHTWEHLRAVTVAAFHGVSDDYRAGLAAYLGRLDRSCTPSGAPIGDEWIGGREADATETGYEYCSLLELLDSYRLLLACSGDVLWADRIEHLVFNAALGARHPVHASIAYLKTDNSWSMTGIKHHDRPSSDDIGQTRYRYSPVHQEAAVCCVPNAGRVLPHYVQSQVMTMTDGFAFLLYAPAMARVEWRGVGLELDLETAWPDDLGLSCTIRPDAPVDLVLAFRRPGWAVSYEIEAGDARIEEDSGLICCRKVWSVGDRIGLRFAAEPVVHRTAQGEYWFQRGPLVYALPIDAQETVTRRWPFGDCCESVHLPLREGKVPYLLAGDGRAPSAEWTGASLLVSLCGADGREVTGELVPMKGTVLRQVSFAKRVVQSSRS